MRNILKKSIAAIIGIFALVGTAHASSYPIQTQQFQLCASGSSVGDTTICLQSFNDINGNPITMPELGSIGFGTIDPNNGSQEESITWTGVTQNANGTAILTGINDVAFSYPFTLIGNIAKSHAGGATFVISNTSYFYYQQFAFVNNSENITGQWAFPYPNASSSVATEGYVLNAIAGTSTLAFNKTVVQGTAGQGMATGTLVYFNGSTQTWKDVNANTPATYQDQEIGIAQASTTNGQGINGGVLVKGLDNSETGLVAGSNYFASTTSGLLGIATTSQAVGIALDSTHLYFDPYFVTSQFVKLAGNNIFTGTSTFATSSIQIGAFPAYQIGKNSTSTAGMNSGTSTFNVPQNVTVVHVRMVGGGGAGTAHSGATGGGGGGAGGYVDAYINVAGSSTIQYSIGSGNNLSSGVSGGDTWFGTPGSAYAVAYGGKGAATQSSGAGGMATLISSSTGFTSLGQAGNPGATVGGGTGADGLGGLSPFGQGYGSGGNSDTTQDTQGFIQWSW